MTAAADEPPDPLHAGVSTQDGRIAVNGVGIAWRRFTPSDDATGERGPTGERPTVVMLHEGLGSITQWRDLPSVLARRCGLDVVAYDRGGYGRSDPLPQTYTDGFMEREAADVLPAVLEQLGVGRPILIGHSDGASIALIAAATGSVRPLGIAVIAPHTFIENVCIEGIRSIDGQRERVISGLARHHDHPRLAFERWRDAWLTPAVQPVGHATPARAHRLRGAGAAGRRRPVRHRCAGVDDHRAGEGGPKVTSWPTAGTWPTATNPSWWRATWPGSFRPARQRRSCQSALRARRLQ